MSDARAALARALEAADEPSLGYERRHPDECDNAESWEAYLPMADRLRALLAQTEAQPPTARALSDARNAAWADGFDCGQAQPPTESTDARPEIVVLCGSTRFKDAWYGEGKRLTYEGKIVLSVGDLDTSSAAREVNVPISDERKAMLDDLHKRKIDLADTVHVLNVGGYIGQSTRGEIAYAESLGKPITYMEPAAAHRTQEGHE